MGDMKTPDFDDLLAAFDIPDMVDPKAAIESGPPEDHGGLKQASGGVTTIEDDGHTHSSGQDVGVSVIVKNTRSIDTLIDTNIEPFGSLSGNDSPVNSCAHPHVAIDNGLQNGCLSAIYSSNQHNKNGWKSCREQGLVNQKTSAFNQFSPISSAEEFDDDDVDDKIDVGDPMDKKSSQSSLRTSQKPLTGNTSCPSREELNQNQSASVEIGANTRPSREGQSKSDQNNNSCSMSAAKPSHIYKSRKSEEQVKPQGMGKEDRESPGDGIVSGSSLSQAKAKSSAKLSFCIAAIAALSAKKACSTDTMVSDCPVVQNESIPISSRKESPKKKKESVPEKSHEPQESALEVAKRLSSRQPDSPSSVTSESSSKGSSASPTGTTPAVPKVRIKTIKTSSGQIKRTVTRVIPEIDTEVLKKGESASLPTVMVSSIISLATSNAILSSPKTVAATTGLPSLEKNKQMTIKPVATAFLPVSAVKTACSQVINLKLANNTTVKATVIPAASVQSASNAILKAANAIQQQTVMVPASSLSNAKPKTVHLTHLNLLPQAVYSASCELQQALCTSKQSQHQQPPQQAKQKAVQVGQVPKKTSRIQMFGNSQSSVVDAFNKVLSSINPVPVYVPNLSPPTSACISLPSRGYKCLECGDSFALEKSLTHHYERRSVRIEVTCNHCAKNLVFYNKCSLLSHARGHKDRGMVMQCSHLILKPIPADQMTTATPSTCVPSASTTQTQNSTAQTPEKAPVSGTQTAVTAPCGAPFVAAMPLDDNATKISRNNLKCLECNEMFLNDSSLAMHYQQTPESNGQKTCTICQMLLPNQCSFASHQRIHQHKSPYICPECGASCRSVHFQSHVTKNCLHYTRRVGYRCVHCSLIFADIAALKSHIQGSHCETFYKCSVCPMAFKSAPGTHSHAYTQHPGVKIGEPKLIYKCSMCDTVFTLQSLLHTHFDQHIVSHTVSVFKCPDCSMHYAHKQLMLDHIKESHGTLKTIEGPPNLGISLPLTSKPTNSNSSNRDGGNVNSKDKKPPLQPLRKTNSNCSAAVQKAAGPDYTCRDCERQLPSREGYVAHMRREHGQILKKHPCRQCEKSFSSSHSLCRHNRLKHKGLRKVYTCPRCPARSPPFTKRILLDQHIQLMHELKDEDMKTVDDDNMESTPDKTHSQIPSPKRKTDKDEESPGLGSDSQPLKKLKVNVLKVHRCAVCGFTSEDMAVFHGHIPQHKSDGSSFQCQSCGLCYTSHRSLARHRFIVHRLREPQDLVRRNARGDDDDESQRENQLGALDENDDGKPSTKCKVCGKVFDTEGHLNTHMRTHGMAFIKSKRLSSGDK